jgi:serine/threonine protein kinase
MTPAQQRYEVVERLDAGGMAEVFRAKAQSMQGFEKQVAIKRVLPNLAKNEKFVKMFLDEARLSLHLSHANIVSVFDIGQSGGSYFIVMEYVDGANLKRFIEAARRRDGRVPVALAIFIAMRICEGLQYAHEKRDADRRPLGIVHRDISPPNVLISNQGEVKLTDFGLAKATSQVELTDPGVVKGKFGYLSPEAAFGETVDARTDIFATGIVLWEMLTGRRLFQAGSDMETLQRVRAAEVPSLRTINPEVPEELEKIILKSLARERNQRFSSAREFGQALSSHLASRGIAVTSYDLASYLEQIFNGSRPEPSRAADPQLASVNAAIEDQINRLIRLEASDLMPVHSESGSFEDPRTWADMGFDPTTGAVPKVQEAAKSHSTERTPSISGHYAAVATPGSVTVSNPSKVVTRRLQAVSGPATETPPPAMIAPTSMPVGAGTPGRPGTQILPAAAVRTAPPPPTPGAQQPQAPAPLTSVPAQRGAVVRAGSRQGDPRFAQAAQAAQVQQRAASAEAAKAEKASTLPVVAIGIVVLLVLVGGAVLWLTAG